MKVTIIAEQKEKMVAIIALNSGWFSVCEVCKVSTKRKHKR